jgi:hypothetical protein
MKGLLHGGPMDGTEVELGDPPVPAVVHHRDDVGEPHLYLRQVSSTHYHFHDRDAE